MKKLSVLLFFVVFIYSCKKSSNDPYSLPDSYSNQAVGASARDMLTADKYSVINLQIEYMPGYDPDPGAIADVVSYLSSICNKTNITYTTTQISGNNGNNMSQNDVMAVEKNNRTAYASGGNLSIYILLTDGYNTDGNVLGFAYRNTSICLFGKNLFAHSGDFGQPTRTVLEGTVLEHELGHLLGLVNLSTPMIASHQDVPHGYHCSNANCLMYYETEVTSGLVLGGGKIIKLDANCLADLHANGGK